MKPVFADTSYYAAMLSPRDHAHEAAIRWSQTCSGQVVTTEFVLMELGNGLSGTPQRKAFAAFVSHLRTLPNAIILPASTELFQAGLDLFARRARTRIGP